MPTMDIEDLPGLLPGMLPRLWAFTLRLCGDPRDAEDILRRACRSGLEHADEWRPGLSALSWMFARIHSTWCSRRQVRSGRHAGIGHEAGLAGPSDRAAIVAAVGDLPEPLRLVMLLVAVEGLNHDQAAAVLGVPVVTVGRNLLLARQAIGARFVECAPEPIRDSETSRAVP